MVCSDLKFLNLMVNQWIPEEAEINERIMGLTKEISRTNTRFHGKLMDSGLRKEDTIAVMYTSMTGVTLVPLPFPDREVEKTRRYDLEDLLSLQRNMKMGITMSKHLLLHLVLISRHLLLGKR